LVFYIALLLPIAHDLWFEAESEKTIVLILIWIDYILLGRILYKLLLSILLIVGSVLYWKKDTVSGKEK